MSAENQISVIVRFPPNLLAQIDVRAAELKLRRDEYLRELALKNISTGESFRLGHRRYAPTGLKPSQSFYEQTTAR
jgi:hypothetical protein